MAKKESTIIKYIFVNNSSCHDIYEIIKSIIVEKIISENTFKNDIL